MLEVFQPEKKCKIGIHAAQMVKLFVPEMLAMKLTSLKTVLIKLQVICISKKLIIVYYHLDTRGLYAPKSKSVFHLLDFICTPTLVDLMQRPTTTVPLMLIRLGCYRTKSYCCIVIARGDLTRQELPTTGYKYQNTAPFMI